MALGAAGRGPGVQLMLAERTDGNQHVERSMSEVTRGGQLTDSCRMDGRPDICLHSEGLDAGGQCTHVCSPGFMNVLISTFQSVFNQHFSECISDTLYLH